ncbi:O-antigen ligase family protein [Paenibacillus sp. HW567]|uniref:O-antigen ligase family protein n=1 Tax=Paenibacillus sp. HW567 TaxID=1034769 RepID=UPI00036AF32B|nr:O-antigen ligase family protein [Paenibacillus sp. HW567]
MERNERQRGLEQATILAYAGAVFTAGAAACLLRGLFFAEEMYPLLTSWFVLCAVLALWRLAAAGGHKRAEGAAHMGGSLVPGKAELLMLVCPLAILVLYAAAWLRGPISPQGTLNEMLRWGFYASFAILAYCCAGNRLGGRLLAALWHLLGMTISLSALIAVCGGMELPYAVAYSLSPEVSATGARLAGLLQYPNAFGAVMAVFLLERLFAAASCMGRAGEQHLLLRTLPLLPYAAALLLSESRGAWLAAAAASAAALLWKRRLCAPLLLAGAAPVAGAALLYRQLAHAGLAVQPWPGLLLLAGLWGCALLAGALLCRRGPGAAGVRAARLVLAAVGWTAAASAVLVQVRERISGPSPTVNARGLMYRDAWRLAAEAPWLGRGGETWRSAYHAAQSRPYVGSQVHSGYLDLLLNAGVAGLAAALLLLAAAGWLVAAASPRLLPPLLVIALHGAVDFDWSYGLTWLLLFLLPALARAEAQRGASAAPAQDVTIVPPEPVNSAGTSVWLNSGIIAPEPTIPVATSIAQGFTTVPPGPAPTIAQSAGTAPDPVAAAKPRRSPRQRLAMRHIAMMAIACGLSLTLATMSLHAMKGRELYKQAIESSEETERVSLLQQSLKWNPLEPKTAALLSRLLPDEQGAALLLESLRYTPESALLQWEWSKRALQGEDPVAALYQVRRSIRLDAFNSVKWEEAVKGMLRMSVRRMKAGDRKGAFQSAAAGMELLRQYRLLSAYDSSKGREHNDRRFGITKEMEGLDLLLSSRRALIMRKAPSSRQ